MYQTLAHYLHYPISIFGTLAVLLGAWIISKVAKPIINRSTSDQRERYRRHQYLSTTLAVLSVITIILLWARLLQHTGTFLGLVGAGVAVALREPLLSIAGRIAIFAGRMYTVGDRIEIEKMKGDVIDVGFFYTRMMEIGNWIQADQVSGRIVQFGNSKVFGTAVFNYTRDFSYIWDEVQIPITYDSNMEAMKKLLENIGGEYTREFLQGAEQQLEQMSRYFLVPKFELNPTVYVKITDNWLELHMRYVVDPKKRRAAANFIFSEVFRQIQKRDDISIASETMDLTVHRAKIDHSQEEDPPKHKRQNIDRAA